MIEIRRVEGEALLDTVLPLRAYAFAPSPQDSDLGQARRNLRYQESTHSLVAFEDGTPMCAASSVAMTQNVRGRVLPMAAVAGVATHPQARRKGYQRHLLTQLLAERAEAGDAVSTLYPFRESFYERFGYVTLPQVREVRLAPDRMTAVLRQDLPGEVRLVRIREGFDAYRDLSRRMQRDVHGFVVRDEAGAARVRDDNAFWIAFAHAPDGTVIGALPYTMAGYRDGLNASAFLCQSVTARQLLLQWIARHVDQVQTACVVTSPAERPETWYADLTPAVSLREFLTAPMGRVLSVSALAGIAAGPGEFVARIEDPVCPWNEGVHRFRGQDGALSVDRLDPDAAEAAAAWPLPIQGLSALVYAGYDPDEFPMRGWGDPPVDEYATLRAMFPPAAPYLFAEF